MCRNHVLMFEPLLDRKHPGKLSVGIRRIFFYNSRDKFHAGLSFGHAAVMPERCVALDHFDEEFRQSRNFRQFAHWCLLEKLPTRKWRSHSSEMWNFLQSLRSLCVTARRIARTSDGLKR